MSKNIFIHLPQHNLTTEQLSAIGNLNAQLIIPEEIFSEETLKRLRQVSFDEDLKGLAEDFIVELIDFISSQKGFKTVYLHLPIGSPAFMWLLAKKLPEQISETKILPIFSHTDRIVEEKNGKKISIFRFEGFFSFKGEEIEKIIK